MRKFYLFLSVLFAFALMSKASTRVLYNQSFETVSNASETGWVSPSLGSSIFSIGSDDYGKYLLITYPSANDRSAHLLWGADLLKDVSATEYTVSFELSAKSWGNNHNSTEYTVMSDESTCTKYYNNNFRAKSDNWLFDLTQLATNTASASGDQVFAVCGDSSKTVNLTAGQFYTVTLNVNTESRTVDYSIYNGTTKVIVDVYEVPENIDMNATGIYFLGARYYPTQIFDNINVSVASATDYANKPVTAMSGINNSQRVYSISFMDGETLHLNYNGADLSTIQYDDCSGVYAWSNNSNYNPDNDAAITDECTSGPLVVWTTSGTATSEKDTIEVSNDIISLPAATAAISGVNKGYEKTYTLTADNSSVPLSPQLFISYTFTPSDGSATVSQSDLSTGSTVNLPSKGELEVTTSAFGYGSTNTTIVNDKQYEQKTVYDLAHLSETTIANMGFQTDGVVESSTSLVNRYATYGRYYYYTADSVVTKISSFPLYSKMSSAMTDSVLLDKLVFTFTPTTNMRLIPGVGLIAEGQKNDDMSGAWVQTYYLKVNDLSDADFVMAYETSNYGTTSLHPIASSNDDFLANYDTAPITQVIKGTENISLYRISDVLAKVAVFSEVTDPTGIADVNVATDATVENANAPIYNLAGQKVNNSYKGVVLQNGKKFIVK